MTLFGLIWSWISRDSHGDFWAAQYAAGQKG